MKKNLFLALTAITMLLASCTIQQRVYQPGLSIEWKGVHQGQTKSNVEKPATEQPTTNEGQLAMSNVVTAPIENVAAPVATDARVQAVVVDKDQQASKKEVKQAIKEFKKEVSSLVANESAVAAVQSSVTDTQNGSEPESWVYVLLILLVPFGCTIAMYMHEGSWTKKVTTNLLLTLLCGIPGLIHALVNIFGKK
jgi:uncharacterized membrane protein YqaE (UPF0057 family)